MSEEKAEDKASKGPGLALMSLNDHKAGMEGLDKAKIDAIIKECSEGSKFYLAKKKAQERIDLQVAKMAKARARLTHQEIGRAEREMDQLAKVMKEQNTWSRVSIRV